MRQCPHANCLQVAMHEPITMVNAKWTIWHSGCVHNECTEGCALHCVMCACVYVHQFTGALLSANMCWCCESLSGYYDDSTRLSVFLQSHLLRRLELFTFPESGTGEGRGRDRCFSRNSSMLQSSTASPHTYSIVQRLKHSVTPLKIHTGIGNFLQPSAFTGGLDSFRNTY